MAFLPLGNSDPVVVSVSIDFLIKQNRMPCFMTSYDCSCADWDGLCDHTRDVPRENIFKLSESTASEFCELVQVRIDACIPHLKYQVKPCSSPCFLEAFAVAVVHRNHFFCLYQQNKSSESKVKFRQAGNRYKIEAAKIAYTVKTK